MANLDDYDDDAIAACKSVMVDLDKRPLRRDRQLQLRIVLVANQHRPKELPCRSFQFGSCRQTSRPAGRDRAQPEDGHQSIRCVHAPQLPLPCTLSIGPIILKADLLEVPVSYTGHLPDELTPMSGVPKVAGSSYSGDSRYSYSKASLMPEPIFDHERPGLACLSNDPFVVKSGLPRTECPVATARESVGRVAVAAAVANSNGTGIRS